MALNERPIPEPALVDPDAVEMLRVWIADKSLHSSIKVGMYEEGNGMREEGAWGKILADVARHLADAISETYGRDSDGILRTITDGFLDQIERPTSNVSGRFVRRQ